jgi:hypothetical protein
VTIGRTVRTAALIALVSVAIAVLGYELFYMHWLRSVVARGHRPLLETSADTLDREIRTALPPGSPLPAVESVLRTRRLEYSYDGGLRELRSGARYLKGSNLLIETSLSLDFHFDDNAELKSIDSRVIYTGP